MSLLSKIHDEFTALRARAHDLVNPVEVIEKKLHEVIDALVAHVHELEASIKALEERVHDSIVGKAEAVVPVRGEPVPVEVFVPPPNDASPSSSEPDASIVGSGVEPANETPGS